VVVALALGSALCYAAAAVLQQRGARQMPTSASLSPRLLVELVKLPAWRAGIAANLAAYALQFLALRRGSLVLVQPLLVSGLLLALLLGELLAPGGLGRRELLAALEIAVGLSLFLVAASPNRGAATATAAAWARLAGAVGLAVVALVWAAFRFRDRWRATLLALGAGVLFAVAAALTKATGDVVGGGLQDLLTRWPPYALVAVGLAAVVLVQGAYQAGPLTASLPFLSVVEPAVGVVIGVLLFHEHVAMDGWALASEMVGIVLVMRGIWVVARSALVTGPDEWVAGRGTP
jgi:drug/metabolite transporter (DMT)-like permease